MGSKMKEDPSSEGSECLSRTCEALGLSPISQRVGKVRGVGMEKRREEEPGPRDLGSVIQSQL